MRQEQLELLKRIHAHLQNVEINDPIAKRVSHLLYEIGENVNSNDYTVLRLHSLYEIRLTLNELPLPTTHKALNSRSSLIQILNELEDYLQIKSQFGSLRLHSELIKTTRVNGGLFGYKPFILASPKRALISQPTALLFQQP